MRYKKLAKGGYGAEDWVILENAIRTNLSSIQAGTLEQMLRVMKNSGDEGLKLANKLEQATFGDVLGYIDLVKKSSSNLQSIKAVNQTLDKAKELVSTGKSKTLLQFEDNTAGYDVDLGVKISPNINTYSEAYQFKTNTDPLTKSSISEASRQLYTAPSNKRIVEFKLSDGDDIARIKTDENLKKELKFQLYDKGLKPLNNVIIDEFHLISSSGERVKVIYQSGNLQFLNF